MATRRCSTSVPRLLSLRLPGRHQVDGIRAKFGRCRAKVGCTSGQWRPSVVGFGPTCWQTPGQRWPNLADVGQNQLGRLRPTVCQLRVDGGPIPGQLWSSLVDVKPMLVVIGKPLAESGQLWTNMDPSRNRSSPIESDQDLESWPNVVRSRPSSAQFEPKSAQFGRVRRERIARSCTAPGTLGEQRSVLTDTWRRADPTPQHSQPRGRGRRPCKRRARWGGGRG